MRILIEIHVEPEELKRFLGIPDFATIPEDVMQFLREKVISSSGEFNPAGFVRDNWETLRKSQAWKRLMTAAKARGPAAAAETPTAKRTAPRRPRRPKPPTAPD
jgi:hypothetical protein